jgi:eukaryotic-like serine/threonine-protein kinase
LKPGNIMLGKYGETLVVDWGLAKAVGRAESHERPGEGIDEPTLRPASGSGSAETVAGTTIGTPAFMSPEQAEGRLDLLGPASDVYSLGATLYCLLTGQPPAAGPLDEVLKKVRTGDIPPPRRLNPAIDPALEAACVRAMSLRPQDRYATPKALADDVEKWLAGEPVSAWPEPWTVRARRWVGRHRTLVSSAAAVLVVATLALVTGTLLLAEAHGQTRSANEHLTQANTDLAEAHGKTKSELRRSEMLLYYSTFREAFITLRRTT